MIVFGRNLAKAPISKVSSSKVFQTAVSYKDNMQNLVCKVKMHFLDLLNLTNLY